MMMNMKSEPPTPTRARDNQLRKMQDQPNHIRTTSLPTLRVGVPIPSVLLGPRPRDSRRAARRHLAAPSSIMLRALLHY